MLTDFGLLNFPVAPAEIFLHCGFDSGIVVLDQESELLQLVSPVIERACSAGEVDFVQVVSNLRISQTAESL